MMIVFYQPKMWQYVILVSCWLVTVGRGSGLTGLPSQELETTTPPHPSRAPPPYTSSPRPGRHQSQEQSLLNNVLLYSLHGTNTTSLPGVGDQVQISRPLSVTASSPDTFTSYLTAPTTTESPTVITVQTTPPQDLRPVTMMTTPDNADTTTSTEGRALLEHQLSREKALNVPRGSRQELFIRRKHKKPFSTKFALPTIRGMEKALENMTLTVGRTDRDSSNSIHSSLAGVGLITLSNRSVTQVYKSPRKPHNVAVVKHNITKKMKPSVTLRKRPISMGIPASSTVLLNRRTSSTTPPSTEEAINPPESDEYYSSYGDYPDLSSSGFNSSGYREADLLPDPDSAPVEEVGVVVSAGEAEVVLPDDSLADTDLHDHDLIDSVMYIYFGSSERDERGAGRQVLIVGAVISLVAQFLTLVSVIRRLRSHPDESASLILLNAELALTASNLVFMLGVQATGSKQRCELIAVSLHYLHMVTSAWFLVNSVFSYINLHLQQEEKPCTRRLRPWWVTAWCGPAVVVMLCVVYNRRGYETRAFCWMSVARGMLYSFMVPVATLIMLNTCFAVLGLRQLSLSAKAEDADRKSMRVSATLLPVFAVVWFLGVVALENSASLLFPLLFVASSGFLNWFVLACWLPADMSLWRESEDEYEDDDDDIYEEVLKSHPDSQPLLEDPPLYVCGRRSPFELQMDPICTISS